MATRDEVVVMLRERYACSGRVERNRILDEFAALTGPSPQACDAAAVRHSGQSAARPAAVVANLRGCRARGADRSLGGIGSDLLLRPLVPITLEAMERRGHLQLAREVAHGIACDECGDHGPSATRHRLAPSAAVRYSVPEPTFSEWATLCQGSLKRPWLRKAGRMKRRTLLCRARYGCEPFPRLLTAHIVDFREIEIVPNAPGPKHGVLYNLEKIGIERVIGEMNGHLAVLFFGEGDVLQTLKNGKITMHLVAERHKCLHLQEVIQLIRK